MEESHDHDHDPDQQQPLTPENNKEQLQVVSSELEIDDEHGVSSTQVARSYDCNFCKRGFSNAQALGGHMNIHRKEKAAKLKQHRFVNHDESNKQPYSPNNIPIVRPGMMMMISDMTSTTTSLYNSPLLPRNNSSWSFMEAKPGDELRSSTIKWPWIPSQHDDHTAIRDELLTHVGDDHEEVGQQLPVQFFRTASSDDKDQNQENQFHGKTVQNFSSAHDQNSSGNSEIDLELRLGHEPHDQDPSTETDTRKFF